MRKAISFFLAAVLLLGLAACGSKGETAPNTGNSLSDYTQPPELRVVCGEHEVTAELTTYTWMRRNPDGTGTGINADGIHPLQMLDKEGRIYMTPLPVSAGAVVELVFPLTPDVIDVRCWPEARAHAWFADHGSFDASLEQAEELTVTDGRITPPADGGYIYEVTAKWGTLSGAGNGGTAYYGFYTATEYAQYYPSAVNAAEITALTVSGLTADDRIEEDELTDGDKKVIRDFLNGLTAVSVPITEEEYNSDAFICGYLNMEFSAGRLKYKLLSDQHTAVYVSCGTAEGDTIYLGVFSADEDAYRRLGDRLYRIDDQNSSGPSQAPAPTPEPTPFRFTRENFPRLNGSTSTVPLAEAVCSTLLGESREEVSNLVQFSKTTQAYYELINKRADLLIIGEANADVLAEKEKQGFEWLKTPFATDAFVFVVNENNPVDSITVEEARKIYTGEITNWAELGGNDVPIIPFQRNSEAGSQTLMEKHIMQGTPMMDAPTDYIIASMGGLMEAVKSYDNSAGAIGYSVYYYAEEMKAAQGLKLLKLNGVEPTPETIRSEEYPIVNPKYVVISAKQAEDSPTRRLYDWLLSEEGQRLIAAEGYVSILEIEPETREFELVGHPWEGEWDGLTPLAEPETVVAYAGERLAFRWPSTNGCLFGLMTREGEALTPAVYGSIHSPVYHPPFGGSSRRLPVYALRQGSGETGEWSEPESAYTLAAMDLSWVYPGTWRQVLPGPDFLLLLGEDRMEQVSLTGGLLRSWDYEAAGLTPYVSYLYQPFFHSLAGQVIGNMLCVNEYDMGRPDPMAVLFRLEDGTLEEKRWSELMDLGEGEQQVHWSVDAEEDGCRLSRREESLDLPVPAVDHEAYLWGDLVLFQPSGRVFLRDGTEILPVEDGELDRSLNGEYGLYDLEEGDLLMLNIYRDGTALTRFIRSDGTVLEPTLEMSTRFEDLSFATGSQGILGIVELGRASYYRADTGECIFRIPFSYEAD